MPVVVDTGPLVALVNRSDRDHGRALRLFARLRSGSHGALVTTDYVLDEGLTLLRKRVGRRETSSRFAAMLLGRPADASRIVQFQVTAEDNVRRALGLHLDRFDRGLSFTDCTLAVLTERLDGVLATFDTAFEGVVPTISE